MTFANALGLAHNGLRFAAVLALVAGCSQPQAVTHVQPKVARDPLAGRPKYAISKCLTSLHQSGVVHGLTPTDDGSLWYIVGAYAIERIGPDGARASAYSNYYPKVGTIAFGAKRWYALARGTRSRIGTWSTGLDQGEPIPIDPAQYANVNQYASFPDPMQMAADVDAAWFTELQGNAVGIVSNDGRIRIKVLPHRNSPIDVVVFGDAAYVTTSSGVLLQFDSNGGMRKVDIRPLTAVSLVAAGKKALWLARGPSVIRSLNGRKKGWKVSGDIVAMAATDRYAWVVVKQAKRVEFDRLAAAGVERFQAGTDLGPGTQLVLDSREHLWATSALWNCFGRVAPLAKADIIGRL